MGKYSVLLDNPGITIGNRIPHEFFVTKGAGESNIAIHAGSYHIALKQAQIESYNIICYSSILPKIATEIPKPKNLIHGSVMECIMSVGNIREGELGTAGIIYGWLYDKKTGKRYGGLVCESAGKKTEAEIDTELNASLMELYEGYSDQYDLKDTRLITDSYTPKKKYGTVLVSLCFTSYIIPLIEND